MLRICAIIAVRNGAQTLPAVLQHYKKNNIDVYIIDNESKDKTLEIARLFYGTTVKMITQVPYNGFFEWTRLLEAKEQVANSIETDWLIHADADEIFESPKNGETLREFIERCSESGIDVIDCNEFVFVPRDETEDFHGRDFIKEMTYYYHNRPGRIVYHRFVRKNNQKLNWKSTGGHRLDLTERVIGSECACLRHYIGLSLDHIRSQYLGRVFNGEELERNWHLQRVATNINFIKAPPSDRLFCVEKDGWVTSNPEKKHLFFNHKHPYIPPKRVKDNTSKKPFPFVVGEGRSGTTLLRLLMDKHPELAMTPETHWLVPGIDSLNEKPHRARRFRKIIMDSQYWKDMHIDESQLKRILKEHDKTNPFESLRRIYEHYAKLHGKIRYGDQTPIHNLSMHKIASAFPEAHFIHIIRDGRDVALSYQDLWFGPGKDIREAAMFWLWRIRETRQQAQFIPHYMEVKYEHLVENTEAVLKKIAEFIQLPFDKTQLEAHLDAKDGLDELLDIQRGKNTISASLWQSIFGLTPSPTDERNIGRWKTELSQEKVLLFERIAGDMLADLGYECIR